MVVGADGFGARAAFTVDTEQLVCFAAFLHDYGDDIGGDIGGHITSLVTHEVLLMLIVIFCHRGEVGKVLVSNELVWYFSPRFLAKVAASSYSPLQLL